MMKRLLIVLLMLSVTFLAVRKLMRAIRGGTPAEVFVENQKEIRHYVANVQLGKIPSRPDGRGVLVLKVLGDNGATHVEQQGNCVVIIFGFMPTDAVPQLWYAPAGFSPLPAPIQDLKNQHKFFRWHQLRGDWGYCEWDD